MKKSLLGIVIMLTKYTFLGITLQCFFISLLVASEGIAQKYKSSREVYINLDLQNIPLLQAFEEIEAATNYTFTYYEGDFFKDQVISITPGKKSVADVLYEISKYTGLRFKQVNNNISVGMLSRRERKKIPPVEIIIEDIEVHGKVTDDTGEPLPGVTIIVKNSTKGTITDISGHYSLSVPQDATLVFSFVGYASQEVPVNNRSAIDVVLIPDIATLQELVVVGYGTQKKMNLTGAIAQIDAEDLAARPDNDITSSLQGILPGLNIQINSGDPTATPDINIRGFNSINGGDPLVLVDGIESDITRVNPQDIKSVTVLKDAASAAIYGARGAFGVILITTKTGKAGDMVVNYSNNFGWTTPTTRTDFVTDPYVYGKTVDAALFGYNGTTYTGYDDMDWEAIKMVARGEIEPFHEEQSNGNYKFFYRTNWYDYLFKQWQPSRNHNISISGGTEKLKGYLSGRIYERETIQDIQDAEMERYNLKANLSFKPVDWLELSSNSLFVHEKDEDFGGYRNGYGGVWSTTTWYSLFAFLPNEIDGTPADIGNGNGGQGGPPAMEAGNNWRKFSTEEFTNTFRAKVTPLDGLEFNFDYSMRIDNTSRTYRYNEFEYITGPKLDLRTEGVNRLGEWRWKDVYSAMNVFGTYSRTLAEKHNVKLLLGYNQEDFDRDRIFAQQGGLLIRDMANLALGTEVMDALGSSLGWALQGYFGRFNYDYKGKYLLEVNARYDGSSRFPDESRWGFFPSVSGGWQIDRESFWEPLKNVVYSMKLRASYGKLGNQSVDVNTFKQLMDVGRSGWLDQGEKINYASAPGPLPSVVSWETTNTIDFGVDFGLFNNKVMATFDWYERKTEGMYLPGEPLPAVFGAEEPKENLASLRNRGFELSLSYNNSFTVGGSPLTLSATASVSNSKGVITKYKNPEGLMSSYWEGQELGQIWGYHVDGQFQSDEEAEAYQNSFDNPSNSIGNVYNYVLNVVQNSEWNKLRAGDIKYVDTDGDGRIDRGDYTLEDHGDLQPIGNAMPQFPFGFYLNASWKGFDVSVAGAGVARQNWYPTGDIYWGSYQRPYLSFIRKDLVENAWSPETPENTYPQIYRGYSSLNGGRMLYEMNDYYLKNIGFLRVKNLTFGYTLPKRITQRVNLEKFRIYFSGENLFTWRFGDLTKYVDPEQAGSAINYSDPGSAVGRADLRAYPMGKTFSMGINLTL